MIKPNFDNLFKKIRVYYPYSIYIILLFQVIFLFVLITRLGNLTNDPLPATTDDKQDTPINEPILEITDNDEDTPTKDPNCLVTKDEVKQFYYYADKEIRKAAELTKKRKIQVTYSTDLEPGGDDINSVHIYDPINQTYSGKVETIKDESGESILTFEEFKNDELVITNQETGEIIERKAIKFKIDALEFSPNIPDPDFGEYWLPNKAVVIEWNDNGTVYSFVSKNSYNYWDDHPETLYRDFMQKYEISWDGYLTRIEWRGYSSMFWEIEVF